MTSQRPEHNALATQPTLSAPFRSVRRIHDISIALLGLLILDWYSLEFIERISRLLNMRSALDEVIIGLWMLFVTPALATGIIMVYCHRGRKDFLPLRSFLTYLFAVIAWCIGLYAFLDEVLDVPLDRVSHVAGLLVYLVGVLSLLVPYLVWRAGRPSPLLLDACLFLTLFVLTPYVLFPHQQNPARLCYWPMDWHYSALLIWLIFIWVILALTRHWWRPFAYLLLLISNRLIVIYLFIS